MVTWPVSPAIVVETSCFSIPFPYALPNVNMNAPVNMAIPVKIERLLFLSKPRRAIKNNSPIVFSSSKFADGVNGTLAYARCGASLSLHARRPLSNAFS
jgi:hypothetical protein